VCEPYCRRLAQTVRRAILDPGFTASALEPAPKAIRSVWPAVLRHHEHQVTDRQGIERGEKLGQNGQVDLHGLLVAAFEGLEAQGRRP